MLPRDKRECVLALQRSYELVVGMTGGFPEIPWGSGHGGKDVSQGKMYKKIIVFTGEHEGVSAN